MRVNEDSYRDDEGAENDINDDAENTRRQFFFVITAAASTCCWFENFQPIAVGSE